MMSETVGKLLEQAIKENKVRDAIKIILSDKKSYSTSLNYAIGYCTMGLRLSGSELRVQTLYILNNISRWRHPKAKEVRTTLKEFTK